MALIVGIMFRENDTVHYYDPAGIKMEVGNKVICHMDEAIEIGEVVVPMVDISENDITSPLNKVIRKATYYDLSVDELNRSKEKKGFKKFDQLAKKHDLSMKLVDVHVMFDKSKMIFYFTAEKRVDFREMVKELATHFKIRIELRQIGVRDEAKIVGGLGPCGMNLCCKSFLTDFESISIKMAKDQNLPLNPLKISGSKSHLDLVHPSFVRASPLWSRSGPAPGIPVSHETLSLETYIALVMLFLRKVADA